MKEGYEKQLTTLYESLKSLELKSKERVELHEKGGAEKDRVSVHQRRERNDSKERNMEKLCSDLKEDMYGSLCYFINSDEELQKVQSEMKDGLNKHRSVAIKRINELIPDKVDLSLIGKPNANVKCKSISIFFHSTCTPRYKYLLVITEHHPTGHHCEKLR